MCTKLETVSKTTAISENFHIPSKGKQSRGTPHRSKDMRNELTSICRQSVW